MLGLRFCRQAIGVGGEKGERLGSVLLIFGQVKADATDKVPRWIQRVQEIFGAALMI